MGFSTARWFAAGCGLAVASLGMVAVGYAVGHVAVNSGHHVSQDADVAAASLDALTPAVDPASADDAAVIAPHASPAWLEVPLQRPRALRDNPPVAPPPPLPLRQFDRESRGAISEAVLPTPEATLHWNPDDARMPERSSVVARAYWNPDSATLPRAEQLRRATWNPDDARLPSS